MTLGFLCSAGFASNSEATITSDELEILDNGQRTLFTGHVVLKQEPYVLHADKMVRTRETGVVEAEGRLDGLWVSPEGEKVRVKGDRGRYTPSFQTIEVWGPRKVFVRIDGKKGTATFRGHRGWVYLEPGKARLAGDVQGHVIPGAAL